MSQEIITTNNDRILNKKVLFVPDSIWGDLSGHRSSKYLVKVFNEVGAKVGIYAPKKNYTPEQEEELKGMAIYFEQKEYSYIQNIKPNLVEEEFMNVIKSFKPDIVFYMGTIKNKVTIDICNKHDIQYSYLPLTTEYYCVKDFAGLEDGPCFECIKKPIFSPFKNKCLGSRRNIFKYLKEITFSIKSKPRIINANKIIGYSNNQLSVLNSYGVNQEKMIKLPVFFDKDTIRDIKSSCGDYFVMAGQNITAKGWHIIPKIIKKSKNTKFKLIMRSENIASKFIKENDLNKYLDDGIIEIETYLQTHEEILNVMAKSRGVLVPSYYASTGEFYMLEALGLGKPVILFNVGIHGEIISHNENGMISEVGDIDKFSKNIEEVNMNDALFEKLSSGAKQLFEELLSLDKFKNNIDSYFS